MKFLREKFKVSALAAAATTAVLVFSAAGPAQAAGGVRHGTAASACPRVLFVGARGSGESPGLGPEISYVLSALLGDLAGYPQVQQVAVDYPAYPVSYLKEFKTNQNAALYFQGLNDGVTWTLDFLTAQAIICPNQEVVLAGYSQGAMVMHRVLHDLPGISSGASILSRVRNAVLIGDGDRISNDTTLAGSWSGTAPASAEGVGQIPFFNSVSGSPDGKFSPGVGVRVLSVCQSGDLVCDELDVLFNCKFSDKCWNQSVNVHTSYSSNPAQQALLTAAAQQVAYDVI